LTTWTPPTAGDIERTIQEMVRRIVDGFDPQRIVLLGSQARGDAGPDSDIDLLVLMQTDSRRRSAVEIRMALDDIVIPKDIVVVPPDDFERRKDTIGTLEYPAAREGRVLYDRQR